MESLKEARSGASTPYRPSGLSSLSRNLSLSLPKTSSTAGSEDMRRNIEVLRTAQTHVHESGVTASFKTYVQEKEQELQKLNAARVSVLEVTSWPDHGSKYGFLLL